MVRRTTTLTLKIHRASGRLYKCIGKAFGKDGKPKPKIFYFDPTDPDTAALRIIELKARWRRLRNAGNEVWDQSKDYLCTQEQVGRPSASQPAAMVVKVEDGLSVYLENLKLRWESGQCSRQHYTSQRERLNKGVSRFGALPLSAIGRERLEGVVLWLCARPDVRWTKCKAVSDLR